MRILIRVDQDHESEALVVCFKNRPRQRIAETSAFIAEAGIPKDAGNGYSFRVDRRPEHQGGDQVHIFGPRNQKWAYRSDGSRSERTKYTLPTTKVVRDIVRVALQLDPHQKVESSVISANDSEILVEVTFL